MMKQQQSDTSKKPSRFCKFLLLLVGFKICLLLVVLVEPFVSVSSFLPSAQTLASLWEEPKQATAVHTADATELPAQQVVKAEVAPPKVIPGAAFAATPSEPQMPAAQKAPAQNSLTLEALNRKQEELARREQDLRALEQELDARLVQLQGLEMRLQTMLKDAEETKSDKYKHLVDVLANMKARQAAEVLETLDEKIAVRVLAGMRGRQAGEILTYASPAKAARLTEALARMQMPLE